jgi:hypothetical protein
MVHRPADVVEQSARDDDVHIGLGDACGDDLGDCTYGGAVDDHALLAACLPQEIDTLLVSRDVSHPC